MADKGKEPVKVEPKKIEPEKTEKFITEKSLDAKLDAFMERMSGITFDIVKKAMHVDDEFINPGISRSNKELGKSIDIEPVNEQDIKSGAIELEAFMNERLLIEVFGTTEEGALPVIVPNVGGVNQPIIRMTETLVKRKFVEAMARCRTTKYTQVIDRQNPEKFIMTPRTAIKDQFVVKHDPSGERGRRWLENIMREAS